MFTERVVTYLDFSTFVFPRAWTLMTLGKSEASQHLLDGLTCSALRTFIVSVNFGDPLTFHLEPTEKNLNFETLNISNLKNIHNCNGTEHFLHVLHVNVVQVGHFHQLIVAPHVVLIDPPFPSLL